MEVVRRSDTRWLALVAATGIVFYLCWQMLSPFVDVLLWATVLAIVMWPVKRRLGRVGYSANVSAILTTALGGLGVVIPLTVVATGGANEGGRTGGHVAERCR